MTEHIDFWETVSADAAVTGFPFNPKASFFSKLLSVRHTMKHRLGFACVFWLRVNQLLIRKDWRGRYRLKIWRNRRYANDISEHAAIGPGFLLPHPVDVTIGSTVVIGKNAIIYNGVTLGSKRVGEAGTAMPVLGDHVIVYTGAKLIGAVRVGEHAEIGALSLCTKDIPAYSLMYGIPPNVTIKPKK